MSVSIIWFRQDLRIKDNPALAAACKHHDQVIPIYIYDVKTRPLGGAQQWWLHHSLSSLADDLAKRDLALILLKGEPLKHLEALIKKYLVDTVYWNRCYEPQVIKRDEIIKKTLKNNKIVVNTYNGSLLNEPWTVKTKSNDYYKVFTPYWRQALQQITLPDFFSVPKKCVSPAIKGEDLTSWQLLPTKPNWAIDFAMHWQPGEQGAQKKLNVFIKNHLKGYKTMRDVPCKDATSKLSPHLHFGEISPWHIYRTIEMAKTERHADIASADRFLSEIGWREFSYYLLYHFPMLPDTNFRREFDDFPWKNNTKLLKIWERGMTGFPIVDAGMRELWHTGYMHNRVRMIAASFLIKDLLLDWRQGAAWFLDTLVDADLANNSASWQWVAGSGADAAPYFRIFNPVLQGEKFDPQGEYVRQWVPELVKIPNRWIHQPWTAPQEILPIILGKDYPKPIVDHKKARGIALASYKILQKRK